MKPRGQALWSLLAGVLAILAGGGCGHGDASVSSRSLAGPANLGLTLGQVGKVMYAHALPLEGYGLVGGLPGTGSAECPPAVKEYLRRFAQSQVSDSQSVGLDGLLRGLQAAAVYVEAVLPPASLKGDRFDVKVTALSRAETTSLDGGWLFTGELSLKGRVGTTVGSPALADGPVYIDKLSPGPLDGRVGHVLGGGRLLDQPQILVVLAKEDFRTASAVRNLINGRFGPDTARALSSSEIELHVPPAYRHQRSRFFSVVQALYLDQTPELVQDRVTAWVGRLASADETTAHEVALEAIGPACVPKLGVLLQSSDERIRLAAARCMANLGSPKGIQALAAIAQESRSPRRDEAVKALGAAPGEVSTLVRLLGDPDLEVAMTAYEALVTVGHPAVPGVRIGGGAILDEIPGAATRAVVASRSGRRRVALFGRVACQPGRILESSDRTITLDSRADDGSVRATRMHPVRKSVIGQVRCPLHLGGLIRALCGEGASATQGQGGLGVSYSDLLSLLKQACDSGFVDAEFWAGPLPGGGR